MRLPILIEPTELSQALPAADVLLLDLCSAENYAAGHLPGAIHFPTASLILGQPPAPGRLPAPENLAKALAAVGWTPDKHVVVYDDEGGPWAGRFIWTLDVIGLGSASFLNGGKRAWLADGLELTQDVPAVEPAAPQVLQYNRALALAASVILAQQPQVWDARTKAEYTGEKVLSARGGHIPGAIHLEWTELLDESRGLRLREDLASYIEGKGLDLSRPIVTHCQTHRRSGLTYFVGKLLGAPIAAYPGSWSEWGNDEQLPVTTGEQP